MNGYFWHVTKKTNNSMNNFNIQKIQMNADSNGEFTLNFAERPYNVINPVAHSGADVFPLANELPTDPYNPNSIFVNLIANNQATLADMAKSPSTMLIGAKVFKATTNGSTPVNGAINLLVVFWD
jgi:hypothetical protein